MTNMEILGKAILKAGKRHYRYKGKYSFSPWDYHMKEIICGLIPYEPLIFSHDFAKAFWGIEEVYKGKTQDEVYEEYKEHYIDRDEFESDWITEFEIEEAWAWYLKQMILCEEPLRYLEGFL